MQDTKEEVRQNIHKLVDTVNNQQLLEWILLFLKDYEKNNLQ